MSDAAAPAPDLRYLPRPGLARLVWRNLMLNLATLYLYRFWAKTAWRRHLWSDFLLRGDPIEYAGNGLEMFRGFLIAAAAVTPLMFVFGVSAYLFEPGGFWSWVDYAVYAVAIYVLVVVAGFQSRRYRLARTRWRGIPFTQEAGFVEYARIHIRLLGRTALTLGWTAPRLMVGRKAWLIAHTLFGAARFDCDADWRPTMRAWASVWYALAASAAVWFYYLRLLDAGSPAAWLIAWAFWGTLAIAAWRYARYRIEEFRVLVRGTRLGPITVECRTAARIGERTALAAGGAAVAGVVAVLVTYIAIFILFGFEQTYGAAWHLSIFFVTLCAFGAAGFVRHAWLVPMVLQGLAETTVFHGADALDQLPAARQADDPSGEGLADSFDVGLG
jgi:Bacterial protein of unknown function (DUF898)